MLNLIIRNIEPHDIEGVFEMHLQLQNTLANLRPDINKKISEISDEKAIFEKNLSIKGTKCMLAEIDNNIVAFSLSYICKTLEPKRYIKRKFAFVIFRWLGFGFYLSYVGSIKFTNIVRDECL